jgi:hypothetical protein
MTTLVNAPVESTVALEEREEAVAGSRSDVLFLLSNLSVGGSERKIARMANRLKEEGMTVVMACLNGPYTLEPTLRRDLPLHKLDRRGKFSFRAAWKLRELIRRERLSPRCSCRSVHGPWRW